MILNDSIDSMENSFLTVNEVAEVLRVSKLTIWRYIDAGKLPAYKIGRDWRIKQNDFDDFVESRRQESKRAK